MISRFGVAVFTCLSSCLSVGLLSGCAVEFKYTSVLIQSPVTTMMEGEFTFATGQTGTLNGDGAYGELADVNQDGNLDLIASLSTPPSVQVFPGLGDGTFGSAVSFDYTPSVTVQNGLGLTVADLNADGWPDIAVGGYHATNPDYLCVLLNTQSPTLDAGSFIANTEVVTGDYPISLAPADFDGDGDTDLMISHWQNSNVGLYLNDGSGAFSVGPVLASWGGSNAHVIAPLDWNGDGKMDFAVSRPGASQVRLYTNVSPVAGDAFGNFDFEGSLSSVTSSVGLVAADVDGDSLPDLISSSLNGNGVRIFRNIGSGFTTPYPDLTLAGSTNRVLRVTDVNGDGHVDVLVTGGTSDLFGVFPGNGDGTFEDRVDIDTITEPQGLAIGDLNDDGKMDLGVFGVSSQSFQIFTGL